MLDIHKLQSQYICLRERTRALQLAKPKVSVPEAEGYELQEKATTPAVIADDITQSTKPSGSSTGSQEEVAALRKEWRSWQIASFKNLLVPSSLNLSIDADHLCLLRYHPLP